MTVTVGVKQKFEVATLTGETLDLQTEGEQRYFAIAQERYLSEFKFTVASDLRALDRLVFYETMIFRWQTQLGSGRDSDGSFLSPREEEQLRKNIKETSPLVHQIQDDLGLTKAQRDKDQHESVGAYIAKLQQAAKEHGVRREKQLGKALELTKELFSLTGTYRRSTQHEREKLGIENAEVILDWILAYMKPEFDHIDEHFRTHQQRFWLRQL